MSRDKDFVRDMLRLYAVTDRAWTGKQTLYEQVEAALVGGATCVQLREKALKHDDFLREARQMRALCSRFGVPLMINDNVEIALACGADGVHVGQEDMDAKRIRDLAGGDFIIGVTAKTVPQAIAAQEAGADYLGSGAVFGTTTKPGAKPMTLDLLTEIAHAAEIPVVAIGGICRENISRLAGTGVCGAAVVSGIFAAADIRREAEILRACADRF